MTLRRLFPLNISVLVFMAAAHPRAQSDPQNGTHAAATHVIEVTPFISRDSTFAWRLGAAISFSWTSKLSVETEINSSTGINRAQADEVGASANVLYSPRPMGRLIPYVAGGAGLEQYGRSHLCADCVDAVAPFVPIKQLSRTAALNAGTGVKIQITENMRLRTDARWFNGLGRDTPHGFWRDARQHWRIYTGVTFGVGSPRSAIATRVP
jgi:opacity protein-like surface antigen